MMLKLLREFLGQKKGIATVVGVIVALGSTVGLELDAAALTAVMSPIIAYILGQGIADAGKEAVKAQKD